MSEPLSVSGGVSTVLVAASLAGLSKMVGCLETELGRPLPEGIDLTLFPGGSFDPPSIVSVTSGINHIFAEKYTYA